MWNLCSDVYFVKGAHNALLYDLDRGLLFKLNIDAKNTLSKALSGNYLNPNEEQFLEEIERKNLITHELLSCKRDIADLKEENTIDFAWVEITDICNLKCVHCYNEAKCNHGNIMALEDFKYIIDELEKNNIRKVQLIGGEPFILGRRIFEYLNYLLGKFDFVEIFTNGTLVENDFIPYFAENKIKFALSVYSNLADNHDKVTQRKGAWNKTNQTIRKLNAANIKYRICNVLMKNIQLGNNNSSLYKLNPNKDVVRLTGRANFSLLTPELIKKRLITSKCFRYPINKKMIRRFINGHNCFSSKIYVSVHSEVYPCVMERRVSHGNLKHHTLKEILNDKIMKLTKDCIDECKNCEYRYVCHDCRPDSNGNKFLSKPWYCTYDPYTGRWLPVQNFINKLIESSHSFLQKGDKAMYGR
mgnify:CR=1 FL=1